MAEKTIIGILASQDDTEKNTALANILKEYHQNLQGYHLLMTGGTYARLFGDQFVFGSPPGSPTPFRLDPTTKNFLLEECGVTRLPPASAGGITLLSFLLTQRKVSIIWPLLSPITTHLLFPDNLALLRLADQWRAKKLMNKGSVIEWIRREAERDVNLNVQTVPLKIEFQGGQHRQVSSRQQGDRSYLLAPPEEVQNMRGPDLKTETGDAVIALISHDEMKPRMIDFVLDYEHELRKFDRILATGTTGGLIVEAAPSLREKVTRYHSGPKGGDIEIAAEILFHRCDVVIFLVDPLHPQPHTDDIRVVFGSCMSNDEVVMLANEAQARDWMDTVVRGR